LINVIFVKKKSFTRNYDSIAPQVVYENKKEQLHNKDNYEIRTKVEEAMKKEQLHNKDNYEIRTIVE